MSHELRENPVIEIKGGTSMADVWLVTGVSGCGRIEMLNDLREYAATKGKTVKVIDVGEVIQKKAVDNHVTFRLSRILNMDQEKLSLLRRSLFKALIRR